MDEIASDDLVLYWLVRGRGDFVLPSGPMSPVATIVTYLYSKSLSDDRHLWMIGDVYLWPGKRPPGPWEHDL